MKSLANNFLVIPKVTVTTSSKTIYSKVFTIGLYSIEIKIDGTINSGTIDVKYKKFPDDEYIILASLNETTTVSNNGGVNSILIESSSDFDGDVEVNGFVVGK